MDHDYRPEARILAEAFERSAKDIADALRSFGEGMKTLADTLAATTPQPAPTESVVDGLILRFGGGRRCKDHENLCGEFTPHQWDTATIAFDCHPDLPLR